MNLKRHEKKDDPLPNESRLVLALSDHNHIEIAGVKIYLHEIRRTGASGIREIKLLFIGPKSVKIDRSDRAWKKTD